MASITSPLVVLNSFSLHIDDKPTSILSQSTSVKAYDHDLIVCNADASLSLYTSSASDPLSSRLNITTPMCQAPKSIVAYHSSTGVVIALDLSSLSLSRINIRASLIPPPDVRAKIEQFDLNIQGPEYKCIAATGGAWDTIYGIGASDFEYPVSMRISKIFTVHRDGTEHVCRKIDIAPFRGTPFNIYKTPIIAVCQNLHRVYVSNIRQKHNIIYAFNAETLKRIDIKFVLPPHASVRCMANGPLDNLWVITDDGAILIFSPRGDLLSNIPNLGPSTPILLTPVDHASMFLVYEMPDTQNHHRYEVRMVTTRSAQFIQRLTTSELFNLVLNGVDIDTYDVTNHGALMEQRATDAPTCASESHSPPSYDPYFHLGVSATYEEGDEESGLPAVGPLTHDRFAALESKFQYRPSSQTIAHGAIVKYEQKNETDAVDMDTLDEPDSF